MVEQVGLPQTETYSYLAALAAILLLRFVSYDLPALVPPRKGAFAHVIPDSPDEMALGRLRAPISIGRSNSYAGSSSRILADPTGERRSRRFRQHFRGLRSCRPNPSGESGIKSFCLCDFGIGVKITSEPPAVPTARELRSVWEARRKKRV